MTWAALARRAAVSLLALTLAGVPLVACTGERTSGGATPTIAPVSSSPTPVDRATRIKQGERALTALTKAAQSDDDQAVAGLSTTRDPGFKAELAQLATNLAVLDKVEWRLTQRTVELSEKRRELLGPEAWVGMAEVSWTLTGAKTPASHNVWVTFVPDGEHQLVAGLVDGVKEAAPLWLLEPVKVRSSGRATVLAGSRVDPEPWLVDTAQAAQNVSGAQLGAATKGWDKRLVVVVPSNERLLERMLRLEKNEYNGIAAVTVPETTDQDSRDALRIVVNPGADMEADVARLVLTHEGVHVATDSVHSRAPLWLVEGMADLVANDAYPWAGEAQQAEARPALRSRRPGGLPGRKEFDPGADNLDVTYLRAWLAARHVRQHYGVTALVQYYVHAGTQRAQNMVDTAYIGRLLESDLARIAAGETLP